MFSISGEFKYGRARKGVIIGGPVIPVYITVLSCVSLFLIGGSSTVAQATGNIRPPSRRYMVFVKLGATSGDYAARPRHRGLPSWPHTWPRGRGRADG
jgi:hypothetical protein